MEVKQGQARTLDVMGKTLKGLSFKAYLLASAVNVPIGAKPIDFNLVTVEVILERLGKPLTIMKGKLSELFIHDGFDGYNFYVGFQGDGLTLRMPATSIKHEVVSGAELGFGGIIDLNGNDLLKVTVEVQSGALSSNVDAGASFLEFETVETVGIEIATPVTRTLQISPGESNFRRTFPDNLKNLTFVCLDKTTSFSADKVINSITLTADEGYRKIKFYNELVIERFGQLKGDYAQDGFAPQRHQNFRLYDDPADLDSAEIDINLNSANVVTGQCSIVYTYWDTDPQTYAIAELKNQQGQQKWASKVQ